MDFISSKRPQIRLMLKTIGIGNVKDLFSHLPSALLLKAPSKHHFVEIIKNIVEETQSDPNMERRDERSSFE